MSPSKAAPTPSKRQARSSSRGTASRGTAAKSSSPSRRSSAGPARSRAPLIRLPKWLTGGKKGRPLVTRISPERQLDLLGVILSLLGLLTLLSLVSSSRGTLTGWWLGSLSTLVGWGVYLLPVALLAVGLWLVLRNIERLPQVALERLVGLALLYLSILGFLHLVGMLSSGVLEPSEGGGMIGGWIAGTLVNLLGQAGSIIVLLALLITSLALSLDVSIPEVFRWVPPLVARISAAWNTYIEERRQRIEAARLREESARGLPPSFTPLSSPYEEEAYDEDEVETEDQSGQHPPVQMAGAVSAANAAPWVIPQIETILEQGAPQAIDAESDRQRARVIEETLASFGAPGHIVEIHRGPTITQFGLEPDFVENRAGRTRVRVSKIVALADDLALALAAQRIRIQAPVPGRAYVGIEVPNNEISRVALRDVIESDAFQKLRSPLRFALGKDVAGKPVSTDLTAMPHLLIAGTTGSGKSVCVNAILTCLLLNNTPDDVRLILVDPKRVELTGYNGIPHLLAPVVVDTDRVVGALQWMMREMDNRYHKFAQVGSRNIVDYNAKLQAKGEKRIPYLVVVIDELADLMMLAPDETERTITRLAQLSRATGLHLILATQRPSVDVLTGLIKANFPARIAFAVASGVDSRVILDRPGAERRLGRGDMLFQAPDAPAPARLQGVYVSDTEIQRLVAYWRNFGEAAEPVEGTSGPVDSLPQGVPLKQMQVWQEMEEQEDEDPLLNEAIDLVRREGRASISMLQRRMRIGYTRAARMIDRLEEKGIIAATQPNSPVRQVPDYGPVAPPEDADLS